MSEEVTEHAVMMSGGGMHIRCAAPEVENVYPLTKWIEHQQRRGGKVYRRRVVVLEDWTEVEES